MACSTRDQAPTQPRPDDTSGRGSPDVTTARPPADQRAPILGQKWSFNRLEPQREALSRLKGTATWAEVVLCEAQGSSTAAPFDWSRADAQLDQAVTFGVETWLKLRIGSCGGDRPEPTSAGERGPSAPPRDLPGYERFVTEATRHFAGRGVRTFAIENEHDALNFWQGGAQAYKDVATAGAAAVRAVPGVRVLGGGLSSEALGLVLAKDAADAGDIKMARARYRSSFERRPTAGQAAMPRVTSDEDLRRVLAGDRTRRAVEALAAEEALLRDGIVDAYQLHWYEPAAQLPELLALLRRRFGPSVPIEAWEVGVAWPGDQCDDACAAGEAVRLVATLLGSGVQRIVYLPLAYAVGGTYDREIFRGLLNPGGQPRPAGVLWTELAGNVQGLSGSPTAVDEGGLNGVRLPRSDGDLLLVWPSSAGVAFATGDVADLRRSDGGRPDGDIVSPGQVVVARLQPGASADRLPVRVIEDGQGP